MIQSGLKMSAQSFMDWPVVPQELRPKSLFHMSNIPAEEQAALTEGGWKLVDVRLLPENTLEEKEFAVKAWLQGVRLKSIEPGRGQIHFSELEAKVYGLLLQKKPEVVKKGLEAEDLDGILAELTAKRTNK